MGAEIQSENTEASQIRKPTSPRNDVALRLRHEKLRRPPIPHYRDGFGTLWEALYVILMSFLCHSLCREMRDLVTTIPT